MATGDLSPSSGFMAHYGRKHMQYWIDSSENGSPLPEDAIEGPYLDLAVAQGRARALASEKPETEFYVNKTETTVTQVYVAQAVINMETRIVDTPQP